jgi:hypothetical protein
MPDPYRIQLESVLNALDYRDPDVLLQVAMDLAQIIERANTRVAAKRQELAKMNAAVADLSDVRDRLRKEADYLKRREAFETANVARIEGTSPNPEVRR